MTESRQPNAECCLNYLKQLAATVGLSAEGRNLLTEQYNKIKHVHRESVLNNYLNGTPE